LPDGGGVAGRAIEETQMEKETFKDQAVDNVLVNCQGDLVVRGRAESRLHIRGDQYETIESEKGTEIRSLGDLDLGVPAAAAVTVAMVQGDLVIKNLSGEVVLEEIMGDALLQSLGAVDVSAVRGDLAVRSLSGNFRATEISGDASLRNVQSVEIDTVQGDLAIAYANGSVQLGTVMGDVSLRTVNAEVTIAEGQRDANLRNLGGRAEVTRALGDVRLLGGLAAGKHHLAADGDIVVIWPADTPLRVEATAPTIRNRLPLSDLVESQGHLTGQLGDGETVLILEAGGRIILKEYSPNDRPWSGFEGPQMDVDVDLTGLGEHIAEEINSRMADFSGRLEREFGPKLASKLERRAEAVAAKAERAAAQAVRKAERATRRARWANTPPAPRGFQSAPRRESVKENPVTAEEQLKILKMVESGVISPDEANALLEAIQG
jgi:hypothetical protein